MAAHSEIGASGAYRWTTCPGSVGLIRKHKIPNVTTQAAAEGTAAHEMAAGCLINGYGPESRLGQIIKVECEATKRVFDIEVDQEMCEGVNMYRRAIKELAEEMEGRPPTLCVLDFKYGSGKVVEVKNNKQLKQYALGALLSRKQGVEVGFDMTEIHPLMFGTADFVFANYPMHKHDQPEFVRYGIVQPRAYHPVGPVRYDEVHATDLIMYAHDLKLAAEATDDPDAPLVPGAEQCEWCPAAAVCSAVQSYRTKAAAMLPWPVQKVHKETNVVPKVSDVRPTFTNLTPEQISEAMKVGELAKVAIAALHEHAYNVANSGVQIPGFKLVEKQARRKLKEGTQEEHVVNEFASRGLVEIQLYEPAKLKSISQLEDAIKEVTPLTGIDRERKAGNKRLRESLTEDLNRHYEAKSSGLTLVPDTDKREPAKLLTAKDIFKPIMLLPISTAALSTEEK